MPYFSIAVAFFGLALNSYLAKPAAAQEFKVTPIQANSSLPIMLGLGLPNAQGASLVDKGGYQLDVAYAVSSNANDAGSVGDNSEQLIIDAETHSLNLSLAYGLSQHWQVYGRFSYLQHQAGFLDGLIDDWHELFGLPQGDRDDLPQDQIQIASRAGQSERLIESKQQGVSDAQIGFSYQLIDSASLNEANSERSWLDASQLTIELSLPTGDEDKLTGSDKTDLSVSWNNAGYFKQSLAWHANLGVLFPGEQEYFGIKVVDSAWFSSVGLHWQFANSWRVVAQADWHQALFDSAIPELNQAATSLSFELRRTSHSKPSDKGMEWGIYFSEDVSVNRAPDFSFGINTRIAF
jgi:hypothetical protein